MYVDQLPELKARMIASLHPVYGLREASNIMSYYFDSLDKNSQVDIDHDIRQLVNGMPVQYVVNNAFFYGHEFYVDHRVLIPRPETEELVHWVISDNTTAPAMRILDIGTGSGCIIISLLRKLKQATGVALDVDADALDVCQRNAKRHQVEIDFVHGDILNMGADAFHQPFDIIVCNPPYILELEEVRMDKHVVEHEPRHAFFVDGDDPLVFYKEIIRKSPEWLSPNGVLYFETSDLYHNELASFLKERKLDYRFREDMQGEWRMLKVAY